MNIIFVGVTTFQERTWGRVFVQYEKNNELFFAFKNWMKFEENTYFGKGKLEDERAYNWFLSENINIFKNSKDVLNGAADDLFLTPVEYKEKYGTPSVILKRLLIEIRANDYQKVENRRGWYNRSQLEEILEERIITYQLNEILLYMHKNHVPCGEVKDLANVFKNEAAQRLIREENIEGETTKRVSGIAFQTKENN